FRIDVDGQYLGRPELGDGEGQQPRTAAEIESRAHLALPGDAGQRAEARRGRRMGTGAERRAGIDAERNAGDGDRAVIMARMDEEAIDPDRLERRHVL